MTVLEQLADRQAIFSTTANALKSYLDRARWLCFALSIAGATLAAVASALQGDAHRSYLTWTAAGMLAIGTFVTARFLSKDATALYVTARMTAETLKREAYLFATSAPPYDDGANRNDKLASTLEAIEDSAKGLTSYERKATTHGSCPRVALDRDGYIAKRLDAQINYYTTTADKLSMPSRVLHGAELALAAAAAVITAVAASVGKGSFDLAALTAVITTLAGTVLAHLQAVRYDEQIVNFRATARRLTSLKTNAPAGQTAAGLATLAEEVISSETKGWQALLLHEKRQ